MTEWIMGMLGILLYLFEGYCIQFFFGRFAEPRLHRLRNVDWAAGIAWIVIRIAGGGLFRETDSVTLIAELVFNTAVLLVFCMGWYKGDILLKVFLAIQFISLRELAFWAGYSLLYVGNSLMDFLTQKAGDMALVEYIPITVDVLACFSVALVAAIEGILLFASVREIVSCYHCREKGRMDKGVVFYLLPAVAGVLVAVLVRLLVFTVADGVTVLLYERHPALYFIIPMIALVLLGAIVFSFHIYQNMAALQEERTEKIILENQITQMQSSMVEMEHLYDGIRSVKHDMKNHMAVLQNLIRKRYSGEDEEIRQYFEGMYQSVEQLDSRVHTGNAVSDAVVGSKFRYAAKKVKDIRLNARGFMLSDAIMIEAYDMGIILNNGLDNAIEACMRMREKQPDSAAYITIRSFKAKNMFFIEIENSFDGTALFHKDSGLPISTKADKTERNVAGGNFAKQAEETAQTATLHGTDDGTGDIAVSSWADVVSGSSISVYKTPDFDPENLVYKVKTWDKSGNVTEQMVNVSKVDPKNCDTAEMYAYTANLKESGKGSFEDTVLKAAVAKAVKNAEQRSSASWSFSDKTDWVKIVNDIMQSEYSYGDLKGYMEWKKFLGFLDK